ncbi:MAG TPA: bifunctional demethylmenaquinone methyltransferase/2-methoxy-6-polyprenyl-1,4-benzoquinol methylase UbiE [Kiritimatiellia bacterium]|nr:bifunctional demethylmenaquinone methyltransferase/2-methoxy-6-polyprenyl-1,4-benzoquinol methylase UbiE [Kiritimatiellia bacterium]
MPPTAPAEPSRHEVWRMFDRIAPRYDLLNRVLSGGRDVAWRRRMAKLLPNREGLRLLDVATGTADQILMLMDVAPRVTEATGVDMAEKMLEKGREKVRARGMEKQIHLKTGDAVAIPEPDAAYDVCTISFGIRNVVDVVQGLREMRRVLRPDGRAMVLEFSQPEARWFRGLYFFYLRHVLPVLGGWFSGDREAYRYLNVTIETFPSGAAFCALMQQAGFVNVRAVPLTLGIASIYVGDAPA